MLEGGDMVVKKKTCTQVRGRDGPFTVIVQAKCYTVYKSCFRVCSCIL